MENLDCIQDVIRATRFKTIQQAVDFILWRSVRRTGESGEKYYQISESALKEMKASLGGLTDGLVDKK